MTKNSTRITELHTQGITKRFGLRTIFSNIGFTLECGDVLALTGRNGSGKSTLLKILANVTERSAGTIAWRLNGVALGDADLPRHLGFVAPYLQLYTEFTAWEQVELLQKMRGLPFDEHRTNALFERFGLADRRHDALRAYSSGMMQRAKFICALVHDPAFLYLDEPMTNFDEQGIAEIRAIVAEGKDSRITIVATNDEEDLTMCTKLLSLQGR